MNFSHHLVARVTWPSHRELMLPDGKNVNWERKPNRKMRQESGILPVPTTRYSPEHTRKAVRPTGWPLSQNGYTFVSSALPAQILQITAQE